MSDHLAVGNNGDIGTFPLDLGLANGEEEVVGHSFRRHGEGDTVKHLVFKEDNRVGVSDCGLGKLKG